MKHLINNKKKWLGLFLRLAVVVGVLCGLYDAFDKLKTHGDEFSRVNKNNFLMRMAMDCALRLPREHLMRRQNIHGNFDVATLGCPAGSDGKTYWTNIRELDDYQAGKSFELKVYSKPFEPESNLAFALIGFAATLSAGVLLLVVAMTAEWVVYGRR